MIKDCVMPTRKESEEHFKELLNLGAIKDLDTTHRMIKPQYQNGKEVKVGDLVLDNDLDLCEVVEVWDSANKSPSEDILLRHLYLEITYGARAVDIEYVVKKI